MQEEVWEPKQMKETARFFEMSDPELEQVEETGCLYMMPDLEVGSFKAYSMDLLSLRTSEAQALYLLVKHLKSLFYTLSFEATAHQ